MKKLVQGILEFRKKLKPEMREEFARLALGQKPDALFVACSDSRVVPNLFASSNPGDLFVLRNVGNLVPIWKDSQPGEFVAASAGAAVEFAVLELRVSNIIVCGHSECGAMQALMKGTQFPKGSYLNSWLVYGKPSLKTLRSKGPLDHTLAPHNQLSQHNVLEQMEHLMTFPFVKERVNKGILQLHGWWFDIAKADVYAYESGQNRFVLIDDEEAERIMKKLSH